MTTMLRARSIRKALGELKAHGLPQGAAAYDELHTATIHALVWLMQYVHMDKLAGTTANSLVEHEVEALEALRDELQCLSCAPGKED